MRIRSALAILLALGLALVSMPLSAQNEGADATLSALALSDGTLMPAFDAATTSYTATVSHSAAIVTVTPTTNDDDATYAIAPGDDDASAPGHQVNLDVGEQTITVTVTAEDGTSTQDYTVLMCRDSAVSFARNVCLDFNTLSAAGNNGPSGMWSDGTTMWVADAGDDKVYAYRMSDRSRDSAKDFDTLSAAGNNGPSGMWSDGTTMWVADAGDYKVYAYKMSDMSRDAAKDFDALDDAGNRNPQGIWSDGTTMWVTDFDDYKVYAYRMSDRSRDDSKDFNTLDDAANDNPQGIWSDGTTMWVADSEDDKVYAYRMSDTRRNPDNDFDTLDGADNDGPRGMWSDGTAMWVADAEDDKLYAYIMPTTLSELSLTDLNGAAVSFSPGFATTTLSYTARVANEVDQVTVAAAATDANDGVAYPGTDADANAAGHQVDLSKCWNTIEVEVTDGTTASRTYTVLVYRGSEGSFAHNICGDFDTLDDAGNTQPRGIWSDGTTMWVVDEEDEKLYAYKMSDQSRDSAKDFNTLDDAANDNPQGIWSDGTTMWVADLLQSKLYAYKMSDQSRDSAKDFDTLEDAGNDSPRGIWSDGTTMWVVDSKDDQLYAYKMSDQSRDSAKDFDLVSVHDHPRGIWSNGNTMWVTETFWIKVYGYKMSDQSRRSSRDLTNLHSVGNHWPWGIWSDGVTMWAVDGEDDKLFAYNMPTLTPDKPASLTATTSANQVTLNWNDPADDSITGYERRVPVGQQKLNASDGAADDRLGFSMAMDGDTMVVGAPWDRSKKGSAYVFLKAASGWQQAAKLTASDAAANDEFGHSVAVSGDTIVVGAHLDHVDNSNAGSAYVFVKPSGGWTDASETAKLTASFGAIDDRFGYSVAVDGDTVAVGAHLANNYGSSSGGVYLFVKPSGGWGDATETAQLLPSDGDSGAQLGSSVSMDGDTVVAGAPYDDDKGSVYVFVKPSAGWSHGFETAKLTASDAADDDEFGRSVAVDDDIIVAGANRDDHSGSDKGSVYVFVKPSGGWVDATETAKLTASDAAANDEFGHSVAVSAQTVAAAAPFDDDEGSDSGSAYVFVKPPSGWRMAANLTAFDGTIGDGLGRSLRMDGDTLVVGAYKDDHSGISDAGSVYVFFKSANGWQQKAKLTASDAAAGDRFGRSLRIDGDIIVTGANLADGNGADSGSAYVFVKPTTGWTNATETARLTASDGTADDQFGRDVSVSGDTVVVGTTNSGKVYVFIKPSNGWADATETATLTSSDTDADDHLGANVAVYGDTVVAGAAGHDGNDTDSGAAYVFVKPSGGWSSTSTETAKLTASDGDSGDRFGNDVEIDEDTVLSAAASDNQNGANSGSAYLFVKPSGGWADATETAKFTASDGAANDRFGTSLAVHGDVVAVGANRDDHHGANSGSVYLFVKPDSSWNSTSTETIKIIASDGAAGDEFGWSVSVYDGSVAVGAYQSDHHGSNSGAAYLFVKSVWHGPWLPIAGGGSVLSHTVTDLASGSPYSFRIRAVNTHGAGPHSTVSATTD